MTWARGVLVAAGLACATPGLAGERPSRPPAGEETSEQPLERVSEAELAEQRGGFRVGTLDIHLGAEMRSYVGGTLVMQTNLSWGDTGAEVGRSLAAGYVLDAASGLVSLVSAQRTDGTIEVGGGRTLFIQRTQNGIQNVIVNTADGVDLRQEIEATIDIAGYASFCSSLLSARMGAALARTVGLASALGRLD